MHAWIHTYIRSKDMWCCYKLLSLRCSVLLWNVNHTLIWTAFCYWVQQSKLVETGRSCYNGKKPKLGDGRKGSASSGQAMAWWQIPTPSRYLPWFESAPKQTLSSMECSYTPRSSCQDMTLICVWLAASSKCMEISAIVRMRGMSSTVCLIKMSSHGLP